MFKPARKLEHIFFYKIADFLAFFGVFRDFRLNNAVTYVIFTYFDTINIAFLVL